MLDLIIRNGKLIDGTGAEALIADVGVKDGIITDIGDLSKEAAERVIDVSGKVVCPGFIDSHNHSDLFILLGTKGQNELEQGITSEVVGPCGESAAPYYPGTYSSFIKMVPDGSLEKIIDKLDSPSIFMRALEKASMGTNMGLLIGHLSVRGHVMGAKSDAPTTDEMDKMRGYVREAMENGYLGFSTGLIYPPSVFASEEELTELASIAASYGGIYSTHLRGEDNRVVGATREALRVAKNAGADLVISHHKIAGKQNEGLSVQTLSLIDEANENGQKVRMDQYPYLAGACGLVDAVPPVFRTKGLEALLEGLKKPEYRAEVRRVLENNEGEFENFIYKSGFEGTMILTSPKDEFIGKTIADIAEERKCDPYDAFFDVLIETKACATAAYFMIVDSDMKRIFKYKYTMVGTDFMHQVGKINHDQVGGWHPRSTAATVKRLCMCRDEGVVQLETEIHRMTGMTADIYHLNDRGTIEEGKAADICIFDLDKLAVNADYKHPCRRNDGIEYVIVNGQIAVENGEYNGTLAGHVLKRGSMNK